jgi:hypothetical protein
MTNPRPTRTRARRSPEGIAFPRPKWPRTWAASVAAPAHGAIGEARVAGQSSGVAEVATDVDWGGGHG